MCVQSRDGHAPTFVAGEHGCRRTMRILSHILQLRNNQQGFCTESECTSELPGPESDGLSGMNNMFMMLMLWMALALALFFLRPKSLRSQPADKPGPSRDSRVCCEHTRTHTLKPYVQDQPPPPADPPAM